VQNSRRRAQPHPHRLSVVAFTHEGIGKLRQVDLFADHADQPAGLSALDPLPVLSCNAMTRRGMSAERVRHTAGSPTEIVPD